MSAPDYRRLKSALVTGGSGFIGRWLIMALRDAGTRVTAIVDPSRQNPDTIPEDVEIKRGSLLDPSLLPQSLSNCQFDGVFHLAGQSLVSAGREFPKQTLETNVASVWNLLDAMRFGLADQLVLVSSDKVCAHSAHSQAQPLNIDPYTASKLCAELVAQSYASTFGLPIAIARFSNVYGGGDLNFSRLVPDAIRSALFGQKFLMRSDGATKVQVLYVKDAVSALLWLDAILRSDRSLSGRAFGFSAPPEVTLNEIVELIDRVTHQRRTEAVTNDPKLNRPQKDFSQLEAGGWQPRYTLSQGLEESVSWYRSHLASAEALVS